MQKNTGDEMDSSARGLIQIDLRFDVFLDVECQSPRRRCNRECTRGFHGALQGVDTILTVK